MDMESGTRLGPYEILDPLGAGGMGEVYRARDTRLERHVAVKVLPPRLAAVAERVARFEQEARAAAALNHPNIAAVHDVGSEGTVHYMVQEYLEGASLRVVLEEESVALERAVALGLEIAEALKAAHGAGVVHRDLKPENVFVTEEGHAKVLDFGLAKLVEPSGPGPTDLSASPTALGTVTGQVMGTAGYMAPEQARGDVDIDHRADVFAFGCLLYELVSGRQAFAGRSAAESLARIQHEEPRSLGDVDPTLPAELQRIVDKCLRKDPANRYQGAADLVVDLRSLADDLEAGRATALGSAGRNAGAATRVWGERLPGPDVPLIVALALAVIAALVAVWLAAGGEPDSLRAGRVQRFVLDLPGVVDPTLVPFATMDLSPGGEHLVYMRQDGTGLMDRPLESLRPAPVVGVPERAAGTPRLSPEGGRWIAYVTADGTLWRIAREGGEPIRVAGSAMGHGWLDAETLVHSEGRALYRTSLTGPGPTRMVELGGDGGEWFVLTDLIPEAGRALLQRIDAQGTGEVGPAVLASLETGEVLATVTGDGRWPRWIPTGHVLYGRGDSIELVPLDPDSGRLLGPSVPVLPEVHTRDGVAHLALAEEVGTLVYVPDSQVSARSFDLVWVDPSGGESTIREFAGQAARPRLSPDGERVAIQVATEGEPDIRVYDLTRGSEIRLTHEGLDLDPVWTPDGERIVYSSVRGGSENLYMRRADGLGEEVELAVGRRHENAYSFSPDGRWLAVYSRSGAAPISNRDIHVLSREDDWSSRPILTTPFNERSPALSPDGRWLAYTSDESGRDEVYVTRFPDLDEKHTVSTEGGREPAWSATGDTLFYRREDAFLAVELETEPAFRAGSPRELFSGPYRREAEASGSRSYDVSADGRFLVLRRPEAVDSRVHVVLDWFVELERLLDDS